MTHSLRIGIAGCGIGGLAVALFLHRAGHSVTLFDQFDTPTPTGSGLVIQPVGLDVLDSLGLRQTVLSQAHPIYRMSGIEARSNRSVLNVDYGPEGGDTFGLGIHRATLFDALYRAVLAQNITVNSGHIIRTSHMEQDTRFVTTSLGETFGPFDLVIDASGARSSLSPIKSRALSYGALWGTVDWPADSPLPTGRLSQCYRGAANMLGILPLGNFPNETTPKAAIFWSERADRLPHFANRDFARWQEEAIALWPDYEPFVRQLRGHDDLTPATYRHGTLWTPYQDRLVFIGDSAHQASPQLGQGANMALLDARALAEALVEHDLADALKIYARKRRWHVQLYQQFSAVFTPFYQSDSKALPFLRNNLMNPMSYVWPVKPMLTRLVCGNLIKP
ncbi:FAD-dependent oxidoreductase [Litorimonas sp. RW-G-Af-16]|uniref:FAD-dependent oxidoreductase n=1 Tax=Litorimonas sp. RW-G-Af-16 TaxID=3241168 RepID=UPI00390C97FB